MQEAERKQPLGTNDPRVTATLERKMTEKFLTLVMKRRLASGDIREPKKVETVNSLQVDRYCLEQEFHASSGSVSLKRLTKQGPIVVQNNAILDKEATKREVAAAAQAYQGHQGNEK